MKRGACCAPAGSSFDEDPPGDSEAGDEEVGVSAGLRSASPGGGPLRSLEVEHAASVRRMPKKQQEPVRMPAPVQRRSRTSRGRARCGVAPRQRQRSTLAEARRRADDGISIRYLGRSTAALSAYRSRHRTTSSEHARRRACPTGPYASTRHGHVEARQRCASTCHPLVSPSGITLGDGAGLGEHESANSPKIRGRRRWHSPCSTCGRAWNRARVSAVADPRTPPPLLALPLGGDGADSRHLQRRRWASDDRRRRVEPAGPCIVRCGRAASFG